MDGCQWIFAIRFDRYLWQSLWQQEPPTTELGQSQATAVPRTESLEAREQHEYRLDDIVSERLRQATAYSTDPGRHDIANTLATASRIRTLLRQTSGQR